MRSLQCSCMILLFSWSVLWVPTHYLLPQSSWIKYIWWCAKKYTFSSSVRLSCGLLSFRHTCPCTIISCSLSKKNKKKNQRGKTGQQLPMSGTRRATTSALVPLSRMVNIILTAPPSAGVSAVVPHAYCFLSTTMDRSICANNMNEFISIKVIWQKYSIFV